MLAHFCNILNVYCRAREERGDFLSKILLVDDDDTICSDLDLPDGSGLELLDMVCATSTDIPFLVVSCHEKEEYEKDALRRGASLCLDKIKHLLCGHQGFANSGNDA